MSEFDDIVAPLTEAPKRIALVLMFDQLPGTTAFDLSELVKGTLESMKNQPSYQNLTVTALWSEQADKVEQIVQDGFYDH